MVCRTMAYDSFLYLWPSATEDAMVPSFIEGPACPGLAAGLEGEPSRSEQAASSAHAERGFRLSGTSALNSGEFFLREAPVNVSTGGEGAGPRLEAGVHDVASAGVVIRFSGGATDLGGDDQVPVRFGGGTSGLDRLTGNQGIAAAQDVAAISDDPLSAIDWGTRIPTQVVDVYFAPAQTYIDGYTGDGKAMGWSDYQKSQIMGALTQISTFTNLQFNVTTSQTGAELRLGTFDFSDEGLLGFGVPPA